jgi:subtilisin family serine protease
LVVLGVLAPAAALPARAQAEDPPSGRYIVVLKGSRTDPEAVAADHAQRYGVEPSHVYRHALQGYAATVPDTELKALRRDRKVAWVAKDQAVALPERARYQTSAFETGKAFRQVSPTGVDRIDADLSSALSGNGSGSVDVNVAVLDTGIDKSHRDLNVVGGVNCIKKKGSISDTDGHGTLVAGIIGAKDNGKYVVGVAPGARLWSVVVVSKKGYASERSILCGLDFVIATRSDGDPANDIAVANLSLAGPGGDDGACGSVDQDALHQAVCRAVAAGVTVVAAAGNESQDLANATPAAYHKVLAVTAMADHDGLPGGLATTSPCRNSRSMADDAAAAAFSNFAVSPEDVAHTISAPGTCILSTYPKKNAAYGAGTSAASPHVAGVVALCIASGPCAGLTPEKVIEKLIADAADHSAADPGYGFAGDPGHSVPGRYYGYLVRAAGY